MPAALADGFIFSVGPDGRLVSASSEQGTLRSFTETDAAQTDRLFLFAEPDGGEVPVAAAASAPRALRASPEILHAIETTALRVLSH